MEANKTFYLTQEGLEKIRQEISGLQEERKVKLGKTAPNAFASEELNSEFVSFIDEMDAIETKLDELEHILQNHQIIKRPLVKNRGSVGLGAKVKVEIDGSDDEFFIVDTYEVNPSLGIISRESPIGKTLLGKRVGDKASIQVSPAIKIEYKIKKITY